MDPTTLEEMRRVLGELREKHRMLLTAVVSHGGVPLAWHAPPQVQVETVATLAATLTGSCELLFQGLGKRAPRTLVVDGQDGAIVTTTLGTKTFLAAVLPTRTEEAVKAVEAAAAALRSIMQVA